VATTALELGVDIGVLDAVIMLGFPKGGLASFVGLILSSIHGF
jgi:DEAD/DEAH box helicase domain-containing protein